MRFCGAALVLVLLIPVLVTNLAPELPGVAMAAQDVAGSGDMLLADPVRPFVYYANQNAIQYYNTTTGNVDYEVDVGVALESLDLSVDMESIYATNPDTGIVVIDIDSRAVSRILTVGFWPVNVCDGRADRLYVGSADDGMIWVLDSMTGEVVGSANAGRDVWELDMSTSFLVSASPDGDTLLVTELFMRPTAIGEYIISEDTPQYQRRYIGFGGYANQQVVDWEDGILYLTDSDSYEVERMSIVDMSWLPGICPFTGSATGFAFSQDFNTVYVNTYSPNRLMVFANSNLTTPISVIDYFCTLGSLIADGTNSSLFVVMTCASPELIRLSLLPDIQFVHPVQGEIIYDVYMEFRARVWPGIPQVEQTGVGVKLNGTGFAAYYEKAYDNWVEIWEDGTMYQYLVDGVHTLEFWFAWEEGIVSAQCTFTYETSWKDPPRLSPVFPGAYEVIETAPTYIEASLSDPGAEDAVIIGPVMALDGIQLDPYYSDPETVTASVTQSLAEGKHTATAGILWSDGTRELYSNTTWEFYVQPPPEFVEYKHDSGFSLPIPAEWIVSEDLVVGETLIELKLTGPTIHDVAVTATVDVGIDSSIQEEEWYLRDIAWETLSALDDYGVEIWGDIQYVTIDGHMAAKFRMNWSSPEITQLMVIIVDGDNHRYWLMTFTSSSEDYYLMSPVYDEMIEGFDTGDSWILSNPALLIGLLVAVAACIVIVVVWLVIRKPRARTPTMPETGPAAGPAAAVGPPIGPDAGFCPKCGIRVPLSEARCTACGAELPSPPFRGIAGADKNT